MHYFVFTDDLRIVLGFGLAFFICFVLTPSIVDIAKAKAYVDIPNKRGAHQTSTPTLGGIAIFIGFMISALIFLNFNAIPQFQYIIAAMMIIFFVGFKDDIIGISPYKKFFAQVVAALIIFEFGRVQLTSLHGLFNIYGITYNFGLVITLVTIIGVTNCFNLMDGIDGLSASLGILASLFFGIWFYLVGQYDWAVLSSCLVGAFIAFLYFNIYGRKNKIFMGDTGSLFLGFVMSILAIEFNETNIGLSGYLAFHAAPAASIGILIIPIFDAIRVFITRLAKNKPPFSPDKTHIHHYLLDLGFSHLSATITLSLTAILFIVISILLRGLTVFQLLIILAFLACIFTFIPIFLVRRKRQKSSIPHS
jgi:UDP-N-acetylmuramyl pentapeptide phosphotransferase/UDP-N-acetylglucosamine-1-phosphate transferase